MASETFDSLETTREIRALTSIITRSAGRAMHERLSRSGINITPMQFGALRMLSLEPHTISELSKLFVLDPSTLVPVVDGLESRGLVERRKDPHDRRRVPISLTEAGEQALAGMMELGSDDALLRAVDQLGAERALQLRNLLRDLLLALPEGHDALCSMEDHMKRLHKTRSATSTDTRS